MARYIDAEKLAEHKFPGATYDRYVSDGKWKSEEEIYAYKVGYNVAIEYIAQFAPTADVVEQKRGRWIVDEDGNIECSVCGHQGVGDLYCERCGARMEGGEQ